jgi:hypothetical protein
MDGSINSIDLAFPSADGSMEKMIRHFRPWTEASTQLIWRFRPQTEA